MANGVGAGGMTASQQRADPQVGSSTSNGQSGSMSQSNLNSIVRLKFFMLGSICFTMRKCNFPLLVVSYAPKKTRRLGLISREAGDSEGKTAASLDHLVLDSKFVGHIY